MMKEFVGYVLSFYGPGGLYDMGVTVDMILEATEKYIHQGNASFGVNFCGDSFDRENVRDIMIRDYGLTFPK